MSRSLFKSYLLAAVSIVSLSQAQAHTTSVGYENAGPGAITFWYGTYHVGTNFTEGSFSLVGQDVTYNSTVTFSTVTSVRPTGLIDGTTNFYSDGTQLIGTANRVIASWQGVSFTNLSAGTYVFTYIPIGMPTSTWQPIDNVILSSQVTLSAADLGTPTPAPPAIIDSSQGSFSQTDAAASGSHITFGGGTFAPTTGLELNQVVTLLAAGGSIDSSRGDITLTNVIDGAGGLTKIGAGTLRLSGANTYAGGTVVEGGALIGDAASLQGPIVNNASLVFDQATDGAFAGSIAGSGVLVKDGAGVLTLPGGNTSTGGAQLNAGTLTLGAQDALGSGALTATGGTLKLAYSGPMIQDVALQSGGLVIDTQDNKVVSSGAYSGSGGFTKVGSGLLNLTGDSSLIGPASVVGGRLAVNGSLSGAVATVQDGAEIGGNGTLGGLIVKTHATAAPGNSIGKLSVATFAIFEPGSTYAVEVDAAGAGDRIDVTGAATLQGGTVKVLAEAGDYKPMTSYVILNAGTGVTGRFEGTTSNLAFLSPELTYTGNSVTLTLLRNDLTFASVAATRNQTAVGASVDQAFGFGTGVYDSLVRGTAGAARDAFDQLSGESHAAALAAAISDGQATRGMLLDHMRSPAPDAASEGRAISGWADAFGAWGDVKSDGNAASARRSTQGFLTGVEAVSDNGLRLGLAGGFSVTSVDVDARHASSDIKTGQLWAYGATDLGGFALRGGLGYADLQIESDRTVTLRTTSGHLTSDADASVTQVFAEVGHEMKVGRLKVEPTAGLAAFWLKADGFSESGGALALSAKGIERELTVGSLGLRTDRTFGSDGAGVARLGLAWRHTLQDMDPTALMAFKAGGQAFAVATTPIDRDSLVVDANVDWKVSDKLSAGAAYQGSVGNNAQDHAFKARLRYRF